jgi:hypothetical protein
MPCQKRQIRSLVRSRRLAVSQQSKEVVEHILVLYDNG